MRCFLKISWLLVILLIVTNCYASPFKIARSKWLKLGNLTGKISPIESNESCNYQVRTKLFNNISLNNTPKTTLVKSTSLIKKKKSSTIQQLFVPITYDEILKNSSLNYLTFINEDIKNVFLRTKSKKYYLLINLIKVKNITHEVREGIYYSNEDKLIYPLAKFNVQKDLILFKSCSKTRKLKS